MIQGQITTINIKNDTNIAGINIPNQKEETRISQYADDSNFFLKNQRVSKKCFNIFQEPKQSNWSNYKLRKNYCFTNKH